MKTVKADIEHAFANLNSLRKSGIYGHWSGRNHWTALKQTENNRMKLLFGCCGKLAVAFLLFVSTLTSSRLQADILVTEDFAYGEESDVVGLGGGEGAWTSEWRWSSEVAGEPGNVDLASLAVAARQATSIASVPERVGASLHIKDEGGANESARYFSRSFDKYSGDRIFIGFTMRVLEMPNMESSFFLFLHERGQVTPSAYRLNVGVQNGMIAARYYHDHHNTVPGPAVESDVDYRVVAEFVKSISGENEYFDTIRFWVNPGQGDYFDPEGEFASDSRVDIRCQGIDSLGIIMRGGNVGSFKIGNIAVATAWDDLFQGKAHVK